MTTKEEFIALIIEDILHLKTYYCIKCIGNFKVRHLTDCIDIKPLNFQKV